MLFCEELVLKRKKRQKPYGFCRSTYGGRCVVLAAYFSRVSSRLMLSTMSVDVSKSRGFKM
jgi:hypothetical protein